MGTIFLVIISEVLCVYNQVYEKKVIGERAERASYCRFCSIIYNRVENGLEMHCLLRSIRVALLRSRPWFHRFCFSFTSVQQLPLQMATSEENVLRNVLLGIEHDDKFPLKTSSAIFRQAAKFILDAERSIVHSFCQKLIDAIQNIIDREGYNTIGVYFTVVRKSHHITLLIYQ